MSLAQRYHLRAVDQHPPITIEIHDPDCDCSACEPYVPSIPRALTLYDLGNLTFAGVVVGLAVAWVVDRIIGGPGLGVMVGL